MAAGQPINVFLESLRRAAFLAALFFRSAKRGWRKLVLDWPTAYRRYTMQNVLIAAVLVTVSADKDNALHLYELQPDSRKLVQQAKHDLPGSPGSQFVSPDGKRLYVSVRSADSVAAFRIDRADKKLIPLGLTDIGANAAYVATDQTGKTLLWASYSGGALAVMRWRKTVPSNRGRLAGSRPTAARTLF